MFNTYISPNAKLYIDEILKSKQISEGLVTKLFEEELSKTFNLSNLFTVNSGTSALHLALVLSRIRLRQEVLLSAQTFISTALAIMYVGAKPVFVDIDDKGNINPQDIRNKITKRTKAIIAIDWGGMPCQLDIISNIAKENNLVIIEDACQALGAIYKGRYIGQWSDFTCFSFQATKHVTSLDGGAVVCKDPNKYELGKKLRWFGIDREKDKPDILGERVYNLDKVGYKYHLNNLASAIGYSNLETIKQRLRYRRFLAKIYDDELQDIENVELPHKKEEGIKSSYWIYPILLPNNKTRNRFIEQMNKNNLSCSVVHRGIDRNKIFGGIDNSLKNQREWDNRQIHLPIHEEIKPNDIIRISKIIRNL